MYVDNKLFNVVVSVKYILGDDYYDWVNVGLVIFFVVYKEKSCVFFEYVK